MGLTVRDVLDRSRSELLEAADARKPAWDVQSGTITSSSLTLNLEGRQTSLPPDGTVEWDDASMEIADVESVAGTVATLFSRGYLETEPDEHTAGTRVWFNNPFPRQVLLNSLQSVIGQLYGFGLYAFGLTTALTLNSQTPVSLPAGAKGVVNVFYQNGTNWFPLFEGSNFRVFQNFGVTLPAPPAIQFLGGGSQGASMRVVYKTDFTLPQTVYDADTASPPTYVSVLDVDLDDCNIPTSLQPHLATGIVAKILEGRDVPHIDAEYIRSSLAEQNIQFGSRGALGRSLWSAFVSGPVAAERVRLLEQNPTTITYERTF